MDPITFDSVDLKTRPVSIAGKDYLLFEATEGAACQWRNANLTGSTVQGEGQEATIRFGSMADSEPLLVSLCLYRCDAGGEVKRDNNGAPLPTARVSMDWVKSWPAHVVKRLHEAVMEMSPALKEERKAKGGDNGEVAADPTRSLPGATTPS